jgi:hypothetical protein
MIEQATVKFPAANKMIKFTLCRVSICNRMNRGIGMRKVMMSHAMVIEAVAWRISARESESTKVRHVRSKLGSSPDTGHRSKASSSSQQDGTGR